jgi:hypothetical protein
MIEYKKFKEVLDTIQEYDKKDQALLELAGEGVGTYSSKLICILVDTLKIFFNGDKDEWIEWWLWECNYGTTHCYYNEMESTDEIYLTDPKLFYDFLCKNK